jgi:hypothetical protein
MDNVSITVCVLAGAFIFYFIADQILHKDIRNPFFGYDDAELLTTLRDYIYRSWGDCQPDMKEYVDFVFSFEAYASTVKNEYKVHGILSQLMDSPESSDYLYELYMYEFRTLERESYLEGSAKSPA